MKQAIPRFRRYLIDNFPRDSEGSASVVACGTRLSSADRLATPFGHLLILVQPQALHGDGGENFVDVRCRRRWRERRQARSQLISEPTPKRDVAGGEVGTVPPSEHGISRTLQGCGKW
jgi:hypothetical protein